MKKTLFITGATGFIGTHLMGKLNLSEYNHVYCLGRTENETLKELSGSKKITFVKADIFESQVYSKYLAESDIVIHLAAMTGKAKPEEYFTVNSEGTRHFLEQCHRFKMEKFIYVSSISVKFKDIRNYPYAQSKIKGEEYVRAGDIPYVILRPTIVIGDNSPLLESLLTLAKLPVIPIFGDGSAKIQPIYIDDLVTYVEYVMNNSALNETIDLGGPEQVTIEQLIKQMHKIIYHKNPKAIHLPMGPITAVLSFLEKHFLSFLPVTTGQLASFTNDGITDKKSFPDHNGHPMKDMNETLEIVLSSVQGDEKPVIGLEQECDLFANYLINRSPDSYIQEKYVQGHNVAFIDQDTSSFDLLLMKASNRSPFLLRLADVYTGVLYRNSIFRKKLVLLLAILECYGPTYEMIDSVTENSKFFLFVKMGKKMIVFAVMFLLSVIAFLPAHAMWTLQPKLFTRFDKIWTK